MISGQTVHYLLLLIFAITDSPPLNCPSISIYISNNDVTHVHHHMMHHKTKNLPLILNYLIAHDLVTMHIIKMMDGDTKNATYKVSFIEITCMHSVYHSLFCSVYSLGHVCDTVVQISRLVMVGKVPGIGRT